MTPLQVTPPQAMIRTTLTTSAAVLLTAAPVWAAKAHKSMPGNGQRQISLARLRQLQEAG